MSLSTYAGLQAAVARRLVRSDLTADIVDFIAQAEAEMNRRLRCRRMIGRSTATIDAEYSAVPSDFLGVRSFSLAGEELRYLTPEQMDMAAGGGLTGQPGWYAILGDEFRYYPTPAVPGYTATLSYWKAIAPLSVSNTSNWVLANHPDAYLYGALKHAAVQIRAEELGDWSALFDSALAGISAADAQESHGSVLTPLPNGNAF